MVNWDYSLLGQELGTFEQHVTREMLLEYVALMGATDPRYCHQESAQARGYHDIIAMPTFITWRSGGLLVPTAMDFSGIGINAGYECTFYEVVYPGDTLRYVTRLADMYEKTGRTGTLRFVVRETVVTNQHKVTVAVVRNPFILGW